MESLVTTVIICSNIQCHMRHFSVVILMSIHNVKYGETFYGRHTALFTGRRFTAATRCFLRGDDLRPPHGAF